MANSSSLRHNTSIPVELEDSYPVELEDSYPVELEAGWVNCQHHDNDG